MSSSKKYNSIIKNVNANNANANNANANNNNQKTGYRSHHTNYRPFLNYIEDHSRIDAATKEFTKRKFGNLGIQPQNIQRSNGRKKKTNNNLRGSNSTMNAIQTPNSSSGTFATQKTSAGKTKDERDAERHADLHANTKTKDFTDSDKIFLLKREVDSLRGMIQEQQDQQQQQQGVFSGMSSLPLLTAFLCFGVLLMSSRFLARKLRLLRASESLLSDARGIGHEPEETIGFELQEQAPTRAPSQPTGSGGGFFGALSSALTKNNSEEGLAVSYEAPSEEETAIRFV